MSVQNTVFRKFVIIVACVSLALLWWVSWQSWNRWDARINIQQEVNNLRKKVDGYTKLEAEFNEYKNYQALKAELDTQLEEKQLLGRFWDIRNIRINSEILPREKVQDYLAGVGKENKYFFVPESLVIQTLNTEESIFSWNQGDIENLRFSIEGNYYMRREQ